MFDNLLYQHAAALLKDDIARGRLPGALLFAGPDSSGKLTCALETARILSCTAAERRGQWQCGCPSCRKHKELSGTNVLLAGPRDCALEILAAKNTFLAAVAQDAPYLTPAARFVSPASVSMRCSRISWLRFSVTSSIVTIEPTSS